MKSVRSLVLVVILIVAVLLGRPFLSARAERQYFKQLAALVHEGMKSDEAMRVVNRYMKEHPQGGSSAGTNKTSKQAGNDLANFVLNGSNGCLLELKFEDGEVVQIVRGGF